MKKCLAVLLTLMLIVSLAACGLDTKDDSSESPASSVSGDAQQETAGSADDEQTTDREGTQQTILSQSGELDDRDGSVQFADDFLFYKDGDGKKHLLTFSGEEKIELGFDSITSDGNGLFVVRTDDLGISATGLADADGNLLIPCEAAFIRKMQGGRYWEAAYAVEETDNEDECFLYGHTKNKNAIEMQSPGDSTPDTDKGDVMYTGYAKIYDIDQKRFVPNVEIGRNCIVKGCGDAFIVKQGGGHGTATVYNDNGDSVMKIEKNNINIIANGVFGNSASSGYIFYDSAGNQLWDSGSKDITLIPSATDDVYLAVKENGLLYITDASGNRVIDTGFDRIESQADELFSVVSGDEAILIDADGKEIAAYSDFRSKWSYIGSGIWELELNEKQESNFMNIVADKNGVIAERVLKFDEGAYYKTVDGSQSLKQCLIYDSGAFATVSAGDCKGSVMIIKAIDENGEVVYTNEKEGSSRYQAVGLLDLFSGEELLPCEYKEIKISGSYVYARKDGESFTVYHIEQP